MRSFINAIKITESVDFHPAVLSVKDGEKYIDFPPDGSTKVEVACDGCDGTGKWGDQDCPYCEGSKKQEETRYNFPMLNVSNRNMHIVCSLMGVKIDDEDYSGWIPPQDIPSIKRRLIRLMNSNTQMYQIEPTHSKGERRVDRSSDIPKITSGPQMIDFGVDEEQVTRYIAALMKILDYAQKHSMGISWA